MFNEGRLAEPLTGICPKHGPKVVVNDVPTCMQCSAPRQPTGLVVIKGNAPGHEGMLQMAQMPLPQEPDVNGVAQHVVPLPEQKRSEPMRDPVPSVSGLSLESGVAQILNIMSRLPMPRDVKQFKALAKIKDQLEKLL